MNHITRHDEQTTALRRIEGQVRGLQSMIADGEYCIDIITQICAAINALYAVAEKILSKHIEHCVVEAFRSDSSEEKEEKISEIMAVVHRLRKL